MTRVGASGHETLLVAEDEPMLRQVVVEMLRARGYTVLEAGSGTEALTVAAAHPHSIHLLLTDIVMPGMGGRELARHLASRDSLLRVLFMSGYSDDQAARREVVDAAVPLIEKPFGAERLARAVRRALEGSPYASHAG